MEIAILSGLASTMIYKLFFIFLFTAKLFSQELYWSMIDEKPSILLKIKKNRKFLSFAQLKEKRSINDDREIVLIDLRNDTTQYDQTLWFSIDTLLKHVNNFTPHLNGLRPDLGLRNTLLHPEVQTKLKGLGIEMAMPPIVTFENETLLSSRCFSRKTLRTLLSHLYHQKLIDIHPFANPNDLVITQPKGLIQDRTLQTFKINTPYKSYFIKVLPSWKEAVRLANCIEVDDFRLFNQKHSSPILCLPEYLFAYKENGIFVFISIMPYAPGKNSWTVNPIPF